MLKKEDTTYIHKNKGVCSSAVTFEVEDNKLKNVNFIGGCSGNTAGIGRLVEGMDVADVMHRLEGTKCGMRPTSCPDQLAQALKEYLEQAYPEENLIRLFSESHTGEMIEETPVWEFIFFHIFTL